MNMLTLSKTLWPEGSGGELATYLYARLLAKNGVNVKIITISNSSSSIHRLQVMGRGKYIIGASFISKKLRELIAWSDIVYCTEPLPVIPLIKQRFRKPIVMHIHSYFPACPVGSLYNLKEDSLCKVNSRNCAKCIWYYERAHLRPFTQAITSTLLNSTIGKYFLGFMRFSDALIFVSKAQRNLFLEHALDVSCPSYLIYNPLPELPYTPIEGGDVGYFGGLSPLKGFYVLLKSVLKISCKHQLRVHATKIRELANLEHLREVGMVPYGKLDEKSYEDVYKKIEVVVFPSIWQEPLPYVVSEALLRGRLLVASRVGGIPEIASGLKGVSLIEPNDANALADALHWILSMGRSEAIELGLKNREDTLKRFDNRKSAGDLIRVFEKVAG